MIRGIPVYVTFDGEGFTSHFDTSSKSVVNERTIHPTDRFEQIRALDRPFIAVLKDYQDFTVPQYTRSFDEELVKWCKENYGTSFGGIVPASEGIRSIVEAMSTPLSESVRILYELENHIYVLTLYKQTSISLIRFATTETEQGWDSILKRSDQWLSSNSLSVPAQTVWIGSFSVAPLPEPSLHICKENRAESIAAAGSLLLDNSYCSHQLPLSLQMIRRFRRISLVGSIAVALITILLLTLFSIQGFLGTKNRVNTAVSVQLSETEQNFCDSVSADVALRIALTAQLEKMVRWSDILTNFAKIPNENIAIMRLGSRQTESGVELAFEGDGTSEQSVTSFITALKKSSHFTSIQLNQFDRIERGGYRFRVQCIAK